MADRQFHRPMLVPAAIFLALSWQIPPNPPPPPMLTGHGAPVAPPCWLSDRGKATKKAALLANGTSATLTAPLHAGSFPLPPVGCEAEPQQTLTHTREPAFYFWKIFFSPFCAKSWKPPFLVVFPKTADFHGFHQNHKNHNLTQSLVIVYA